MALTPRQIEFNEAWAAYLKAHPEEQADSTLCDGEGKRCCLGVGSMILTKEFPDLIPKGFEYKEWKKGEDPKIDTDDLDEGCGAWTKKAKPNESSNEGRKFLTATELPKEVQEAIGMREKTQTRYISINDRSNYTKETSLPREGIFPYIAREIMKRVEGAKKSLGLA